MLSRSKTLLAAALLMSAGAFAMPANAKTYNITFAGGHGTHLPWMKAIEEFYIPEVDKRLKAAGGKDKVTWTKAFGGTLVKIGGALEGVQEGTADMAMVYTIFEPAKLPLMQVTFLAPVPGGSVQARARILRSGKSATHVEVRIVEGERVERIVAAKTGQLGVSPEEILARMVEGVSLRTTVTAQDVANTALFLASDAGRHISGQAISVCGGVRYLV